MKLISAICTPLVDEGGLHVESLRRLVRPLDASQRERLLALPVVREQVSETGILRAKARA